MILLLEGTMDEQFDVPIYEHIDTPTIIGEVKIVKWSEELTAYALLSNKDGAKIVSTKSWLQFMQTTLPA